MMWFGTLLVVEGEAVVGARVAESAIGDLRLRAVSDHGVVHPERRKDVVLEELPEALPRRPFHHQCQHLVAGVRVLVALTGGKHSLAPARQKLHRLLGVGHVVR